MLTIAKKNAVLFLVLFRKLIWILLVFTTGLVLSIVLFVMNDNLVGIILGTFVPTVLYIVYLFYDASLYAKSASIELKDNTVDMHANNVFNRTNISLPISQINSANVEQSFLLKIFGISSVHFLDESGTHTSLWGFTYEDAVKFANTFSKQYKIPVTR